MPACKASARFGHLLGSAAQNLAQNVQIHALREADKVQCSLNLATHGIDITQGVGRCDLAEGIGVIHHRREKIHCLYQRDIICYAVYSRIIPAVVPDQKARVSCTARQLFQNTAQRSGSQLCGTSAAGAEHDLAFFAHARSPFSK